MVKTVETRDGEVGNPHLCHPRSIPTSPQGVPKGLAHGATIPEPHEQPRQGARDPREHGTIRLWVMVELRLAAHSENCPVPIPVLVPKLVQNPGRLSRWQRPIPG